MTCRVGHWYELFVVHHSGVALVFIFSWLLMIAVVLLFVTGGATYTEVCRPVSQPETPSGVIKVSSTCCYSLSFSHTRRYSVVVQMANNYEHCDGRVTLGKISRQRGAWLLGSRGRSDTCRDRRWQTIELWTRRRASTRFMLNKSAIFVNKKLCMLTPRCGSDKHSTLSHISSHNHNSVFFHFYCMLSKACAVFFVCLSVCAKLKITDHK